MNEREMNARSTVSLAVRARKIPLDAAHRRGVGEPATVTIGTRLFGDPAGGLVTHFLAHVDGMVTDPFVEARHDRQLDGDLEVDPSGGVALEDGLNELTLKTVEERVHVVDGPEF